ncbi:MAG: growth inhibitor PemK [Acidimicrobiales bacterium]|nr:MAG: growth inhibitor PemK [Acidimicrobiales bacterium]
MNASTGDLWLVQFNPQAGSEQAGVRPALVVSGERFNASSTRIKLVMPLTSRDRGWPTHVSVAPSAENSLTKPSWILCEQVRAVSVERFWKRLGAVDPQMVSEAVHVLNQWVLEAHRL